ncbi:Endospore coat-associated protein YheD [Paenibacillus konkukensis]|uniref:Endospore coat-associated protein YheD n=1 Tax=Paenibacillus konkukensis TaxID=2020716 RepID=A0ABY4RN00_9BACL|nr:YheC/YheD family protein [Paenibacillus konkukensis]UQZ83811.1 Endospore coat-associated protein YheD [Paenibacillus konkukensis]
MSRSVANKWLKTNVLLRHRGIAGHIPETRRFTSAALAQMVNKYGRVVAKPVVGTGGSGVILIYKQGSGYIIHYRGKIMRRADFASMLAAVGRIRRGRAYLIQRGIRLAQIAGRPVDYRVKLVDQGGRWVTRAIVGRLARPGLFVTNLCRGGTLLKSSDAIRRSLSIAPQAKKRELRNLSYRSMRLLKASFPGIGQLGFDYGIDKIGKIWMFEVNTKPH